MLASINQNFYLDTRRLQEKNREIKGLIREKNDQVGKSRKVLEQTNRSDSLSRGAAILTNAVVGVLGASPIHAGAAALSTVNYVLQETGQLKSKWGKRIGDGLSTLAGLASWAVGSPNLSQGAKIVTDAGQMVQGFLGIRRQIIEGEQMKISVRQKELGALIRDGRIAKSMLADECRRTLRQSARVHELLAEMQDKKANTQDAIIEGEYNDND